MIKERQSRGERAQISEIANIIAVGWSRAQGIRPTMWASGRWRVRGGPPLIANIFEEWEGIGTVRGRLDTDLIKKECVGESLPVDPNTTAPNHLFFWWARYGKSSRPSFPQFPAFPPQFYFPLNLSPSTLPSALPPPQICSSCDDLFKQWGSHLIVKCKDSHGKFSFLFDWITILYADK